MNNTKTLLMSVGAAALSLAFSFQPHPTPFWETNIVIAGEESVPKGNIPSDKNNPGAKSAKMGKAEGTQSGANQGTPSENDTQKIDQPPRQNQTSAE